MSEVDHEKVALEFPAWPGDVIDYGHGNRKIVKYAVLQHRAVRRNCTCGHCLDDEYEYEVYVEAEEPVEVIIEGGMKVLVMPLVKLCGNWPPSDADVWRDGKIVYSKKEK